MSKCKKNLIISSIKKLIISLSYLSSYLWRLCVYLYICIFLKGDNHCLPQHIGDGFSWVIIITLMVLGKP